MSDLTNQEPKCSMCGKPYSLCEWAKLFKPLAEAAAKAWAQKNPQHANE